MNESLGKRYSLSSKKTIDSLFTEGTRISCYPFTVWLKPIVFEEQIPFKIVFSAPKKRFRKAVHRNRIKRITREAIRKQKAPLEDFLLQRNEQLALFLVYSGQEEMDHTILAKKASQLMKKIIDKLNEQRT